MKTTILTLTLLLSISAFAGGGGGGCTQKVLVTCETPKGDAVELYKEDCIDEADEMVLKIETSTSEIQVFNVYLEGREPRISSSANWNHEYLTTEIRNKKYLRYQALVELNLNRMYRGTLSIKDSATGKVIYQGTLDCKAGIHL